jgi:hypothetical protein
MHIVSPARVKRPKPRDRGWQRREWILIRLRAADGPTYDELCREVIAAHPEDNPHCARAWGVRAVRDMMYRALVTTESDESCWLTEKGWLASDGAAERSA